MINKLLRFAKRNGLVNTLKASIYVFKVRLDVLSAMLTLDYWIEKRRMSLSRKIAVEFGYTVKYGPFKGLKLKYLNSWAGNMFLGLYEKEVLDVLGKLSRNRNILVDLGSADGYYGVGGIVAKYFDKSYCFDLSRICRTNLRKNSSLNGVRNKVKVLGEIPPNFPEKLKDMGVDLAKSVVICDIEGNEFKLLNEKVLEEMKRSLFIIEIHDYVNEGRVKYKNLQMKAAKYFNIKKLKTRSRDVSFSEIATMSDNDRWLVGSEGRYWLTEFLILIPKKQ